MFDPVIQSIANDLSDTNFQPGHARPATASRLRKLALLGTFPPERCGIATFTADVFKALTAEDKALSCRVVTMVDDESDLRISPAAPVSSQIRKGALADYIRVADELNRDGVELVNVQHEFGIFGGVAGDHLLPFMERLDCPVAVTLHTVLEQPNADQRRVMGAILRRAAQVIVMAQRGARILLDVYNADVEKICVCPHGAPDIAYVEPKEQKQKLGLAGRQVMLTFGLLSPGKGLETMIRAMSGIVSECPNALYVILGATHPHLLRRDGEAYREQLQTLAATLGIQDHVLFVNDFVEQTALLGWLQAADVYVTPYLNEAQITSGTLAYAIALGKPIVSTPYWHATEVVSDLNGGLVAFEDVEGFVRICAGLLSDAERLDACSRYSYATGRKTIWPEFAKRHLALFNDVVADAKIRSKQIRATGRATRPNTDAIIRMSDDCGILQHSCYGVADRNHGYCIDDNARALILVQKLRDAGALKPEFERLEPIYAAFMQHAWNADARKFRNFMGYDRTWLESVGSEDSNGRAYWALGETARSANRRDLSDWARQLARAFAPQLQNLTSPRTMAFAILGAQALLDVDARETEAFDLLVSASNRLRQLLLQTREPGWVWFERCLAYDNPRLAQALILAGNHRQEDAMIADGLAALEWLAALQCDRGPHFRPVGSDTTNQDFDPPTQFDQQPIEALAMIDACATAFDVTGDRAWLFYARRAHAWFFGANDCNQSLADDFGGCFDGLRADGVNRNQGAESLLALQLSNVAMQQLEQRATDLTPQRSNVAA